MSDKRIPIGFKQKRTIHGQPMTSWILGGDDNRESVYGVFNGGGPKGVAFAGAVDIFEKQVQFKAVAGTSAGAITAALLAAGYDGQTIGRIIKNTDFSSLLDPCSFESAKQAAYPWTQRPDKDWLTSQILSLDPELLTPNNESDLQRRLNDKLAEYNKSLSVQNGQGNETPNQPGSLVGPLNLVANLTDYVQDLMR